MDLHFNINAKFTGWAVQSGVLNEPFVVVDVGVQGDYNPRWRHLGNHLVMHGFDAIKEVIDELQRSEGSPRCHYHWIAAGNADEEREFHFNAADPCSSSFYQQGADRFGTKRNEQKHLVPVRRLDTLLREGVIQRPDFLKIDVEGFEKDVLLGAGETLRSVLGVEIETNFGISEVYPRTHFGAVQEILLRHSLLVFDMNFNRVPRASFTNALAERGLRPVPETGKASTFNVLFCRDLIDEKDRPGNYSDRPEPFTADQIIKLMIIYELHGLNDIAVDMAARFADCLGTRLDIEKAFDLLSDPYCHTPGGVPQPSLDEAIAAAHTEAARIRTEYEQSASWRLTSPLRTLRRLFS